MPQPLPGASRIDDTPVRKGPNGGRGPSGGRLSTRIKRSVGFIALLLALGSTPSEAEWSADIPIVYWEMLNEGIYVYRHDMDEYNWREIREQRELMRTAHEEPKFLLLVRSSFKTPFPGAPLPDEHDGPGAPSSFRLHQG